ncbi:MAG: LacI family DNA-binding transcriptional regulator [Coprobacillaceae bacterium]
MATIKDIAKKLGLGVSTVSMALNNHPKIGQNTKEEVLQAAKELGYVKNGLAADLQKGRSNLILLIVEDASRPFFSNVISQVQKAVAKHDFDLLISTTFENHSNTAKKYISEHRGAAAIVFTMNIEDSFIKTYASTDFPIFVLGRKVKGENVYCVPSYTNKQPMGYKATQHLIDYGHKHIAFVKGAFNTLGTVRRFEGYLKALKDNNMSYDEDVVYVAKDSTYESGYKVTNEIIADIKQKNIDAILYSNDDLAMGGIRSLIDQGVQVPDDISIIGYNNLPYAKLLIPALTSVGGTDLGFSSTYAVDFLVAKITKQDTLEVEKSYEKQFSLAEEIIYERDTVKKRK